MQIPTLSPITETNRATIRAQNQTPFLQLTAIAGRHRAVRAALPARRREECLTKRAMLAALREAEFADWMASGGDYLDSTQQPAD